MREISGRKGQGLFLAMGASPHTPTTGKRGMDEKDLCGAQRMGKHTFYGKLADNIARGAEGFCISFIRIQELFSIG